MNEFRVWCEFELEGVKHSTMATTHKFLLKQSGEIWQHGPLNVDSYDRLIVMFAIGWNDEDGNNVYDGDILDNGKGTRFEVERREYEYILKIVNSTLRYRINTVAGKLRRIGNKYENPELLVKG